MTKYFNYFFLLIHLILTPLEDSAAVRDEATSETYRRALSTQCGFDIPKNRWRDIYDTVAAQAREDQLIELLHGVAALASPLVPPPSTSIVDAAEAMREAQKRPLKVSKSVGTASHTFLIDTVVPSSYTLGLPVSKRTSAPPSSYNVSPDFAGFPVYDQGNLGSCTANSMAGLLEYLLAKQLGGWKKPGVFLPSRLAIYYEERKLEGTIQSDAGAVVSDSVRVALTCGAASESLWPYDIQKYKAAPSSTYVNAALKHRAIKDLALYKKNDIPAAAPIPQDLTHLKRVLSSGFPITFGMLVYTSFYGTGTDGLVLVPDTDAEDLLGGHCMLIVGYNDVIHRFTVRNSWGKTWGHGGYCYIPYDIILDADLAWDFWTLFQITT